jgi:hypothetical protein
VDIYVFNEELDFVGVIDSFISLRWVRRYHKSGEFELHLSLTYKSLKMLKEDYILWKKDDLEAGFISYRELKQDAKGKEVLVIKGNFITSYLAKRIIWGTENLNTTAEIAMRSLVDKNCINPVDGSRKIPLINLSETKGFHQELNKQVSYNNLLDELESISLSSGLGFRILVDVRLKELTFNVYEGRDLTANQKINPPAIFANEFENVFEQEYMESNNNFKNVALIAGEGEGVNRQFETVGDANGLNRYELFVDARDLQSTINEDGEEVTIPADEYKELLINRGRSKLLEHEKIETFESKINVLGNLRYKEDFDLGDIVTVTNKRWQVTKDSRITEVEEIYEANKTSINVTFGSSIPTLVDRIKQEVR